MYRMAFMLHSSNSQQKTVPLIKLIAIPITFSCKGMAERPKHKELLEHTLVTIGTT